MSAFPVPAWRRLFVVIAGPSGSGKSTLIHRFLGLQGDFVRCLSVTTRTPRGREADGVDYFFVDEPTFAARAASGAFLEHARVFGHHGYATPRDFVENELAAGRNVIKDMDVQGAEQIRRSFPAAIHVFVVPPSRAEIERRLRSRGTETEDQIRRRLDEAERELDRWRDYDYLLINHEVDQAVADLLAIVRAERLRIGDG